MNIILFGGTGTIGQRIYSEAVSRGHRVTLFVRRLLVVGGAGSLEVAPGKPLYDSPQFPKEVLPIAKAHGEVLEFLKTTDLDWTYISPPALIEPGERTGHYRRGENQLLTDANGKSEISAEDYAVGLIDELETAQALRKRITFAW
jgi:uncharacterized protein